MNAPKRSRARVLTPEGLQKLRERVRSHEVEENAGFKYTLERLGELTGLDPETVKNVLDCKGSDKRTIARCFETFGLMLAESDHIPAAQATTTADPNFVGRDEAIADLNTLVSRNARVIVVQARGGVGKTTLARKYLQQEFGSFLEFPIAKETKDIASIEGLLEEKLRQLGEEPGREFLVSLDRLKRKLQAERIGILIDNLEPALDSAGKFIEAHRRYVELLRVLSDPTVQSLTLITSRERLREADVTVQHYSLRSLDVQAWAQFFQSRSINTDTAALAALHDAYGGNAKAMDIISGAVLEDFSGDVEAYWQANQDDLFIERDLEDLVAKQFDRLQQLDLDAYKLLCRMGCYRYQDVPTVPIEGLFCLLWDVPENRHRRVIKSLQDRSLIDYDDGEYWLHPVVRAESTSRLRLSKDWEIVNRKAAEYWTECVHAIETIDQGLRAIKACYLYLEINDFEQACHVLNNERDNRWRPREPLYASFYRLGLLQPLVYLINKIIKDARDIDKQYAASTLFHTLGDSYRMMGYIHKAIECYEKSRELANLFDIEEDKVVCLINIAICKIDLGEFREALNLFYNAKPIAEQSGFPRFILYSYIFLAFLNSFLGDEQEASEFAEMAYSQMLVVELTSWGRGNSPLFLGRTYKNLKRIEKSVEMYNMAVLFSEESNYTQVKANALVGLAEIHRELKEFEVSIIYHLKALELLNDIGAKCDLAEAYYQFGLTFQAIDELEESHKNFQEAIRLFSEIEAPKQVERVKRSMQN